MRLTSVSRLASPLTTMHAALAALLLSALAAVASGQPYMDKQTVATADPVGAQVFVERYMGFYRRHFTFESAEAGECANITWNTLCPDWRELSTTVQMQRSRSYNWEWQIHFVHNKVLPSGPMAFGDAYGHIAEKIAPMRKWEPFMQASQSGYLVRDLTDLVRKLKTDGVPVWLTYRRDDDPASSDFLAAWAAGDDHTAPAPVFRPTATDAVPSAAVHAEIQHRREREGRATEDAAPEGFLSRWASSLSRWASYLFGRNKQTATGRRTTTVFGPGGQYDGRDGQHALPQGFNRPRPAERRPPTTLGHGEEKRARNQPWTHQFDKPKAGDVLYTAWVAVPGGVTYTFASFRLDAALAKGAVPFKRPCDGPVAYVHRMLADEGLDGRHEKFWDTVPFPNAHDYLPYVIRVRSAAALLALHHLLLVLLPTNSPGLSGITPSCRRLRRAPTPSSWRTCRTGSSAPRPGRGTRRTTLRASSGPTPSARSSACRAACTRRASRLSTTLRRPTARGFPWRTSCGT